MNSNENKHIDDESNNEDIEYMYGTPSRLEVANYVNELLEEHYIPLIQNISNGIRLSVMVLQSILLTKGVISQDELQAVTDEFVKLAKEDIDKNTKDSE